MREASEGRIQSQIAPIKFEVIRSALAEATEEMAVKAFRYYRATADGDVPMVDYEI